MTAGERSGRGYGPDDEYASRHPAYPPNPNEAGGTYRPAHTDYSEPTYPGGTYPDQGYGASGYNGAPGYNGASGYAGRAAPGPSAYAEPPAAYVDQPYRGSTYGTPGHRRAEDPYAEPGYRVAEPGAAGVRATAAMPPAVETYPPPAGPYPPPARGFPTNGRYQPDRDRDVARHRQAGGSAGGGPGRRGQDSARAGADEEPTDRGERRRRLPLWQELPLLLVIAFCLAILIRTFLLQAFFIPSGSMEDTLIAGDRVLVNKVVYNFRDPARGEVVVFKGTDAWAPLATADDDVGAFAKIGRTFGDLVGVSRPGEKDFIKRVVGLPGDVVSCCDQEGRVFVNGEPINETYVIRDSPLNDAPAGARDCRGRRFDEVVVEPGQLFVMGDHRQRSQDSRCQGQVPIENVIGRAFIIVWPNDRWAGLSATDAFANVPPPATAAGQPYVTPGEAAGGSLSAQLGVVLPLLLPLGWSTSALRGNRRGGNWIGSTARARRSGRDPGRRLSA